MGFRGSGITIRRETYEFMGLRNKEDVVFCEPDPDDAKKILMVLKSEELRMRLSQRGPTS